MAGIIFCDATELYNMLNQSTKYSRLTEPIYLYLVAMYFKAVHHPTHNDQSPRRLTDNTSEVSDVRTKYQYDESHVITAKRAKRDMDGNYLMPEDVELECVKYCVVYDGHTTSSNTDGPAIQYAKLLEEVSRQPIRVLNGGYELFSACYPFFRTQKIFYMPQELDAFEPYPIEILPAKLYMSDYKQSCDPQVRKDLKIKAYVNLCHDKEIVLEEDQNITVLHISLSDTTDFFVHFPLICNFLDDHLDKGVVCVVSTLGISRCCTAVMVYLIHSQKLPLKDVWAHVQKCKATIRPHRDFVHQLSKWEEVVLKKKITDVSDPYY